VNFCVTSNTHHLKLIVQIIFLTVTIKPSKTLRLTWIIFQVSVHTAQKM